jgi:undecaprenyl-diphosphatase
MEHIDQSLFMFFNAGDHPSTLLVMLARILAEDLVWLIPVGLVLGWLRGSTGFRHVLVSATLAGLTGLMINQLIGLVWYHPRPFAMGIGRTLIPHAADSSFPSDHLTLIWSIGMALLFRVRTRAIGLLIVLAGIPVAWARIYLGVHFPLDMAGSSLVAMASASLIVRSRDVVASPIANGLLHIHPILFARLIRRGWVRQ